MENQSKLTLVGLIVVILTISFIILIMLPAISVHHRPSHRIVCATNLKGLGTAMMIYANDYDGWYPQLGKGPWSKELGYSYEDANFRPYNYDGPCTITSSLYMLIREADVSPKTFLCTEFYTTKKWFVKSKPKKNTEFLGTNSKGLDIVELWDFGTNPYLHVSYAYHNPYGDFPANENRSADFAMMVDMNPWFDLGNIVKPGEDDEPPQIIKLRKDMIPSDWGPSNSTNHKEDEQKHAEGQPVQYADGHVSFEKQPNIGVNNDNIYTFWSTEENPTEQDIQGGAAPTSRGPENDAKSKDDSFLAI